GTGRDITAQAAAAAALASGPTAATAVARTAATTTSISTAVPAAMASSLGQPAGPAIGTSTMPVNPAETRACPARLGVAAVAAARGATVAPAARVMAAASSFRDTTPR